MSLPKKKKSKKLKENRSKGKRKKKEVCGRGWGLSRPWCPPPAPGTCQGWGPETCVSSLGDELCAWNLSKTAGSVLCP